MRLQRTTIGRDLALLALVLASLLLLGYQFDLATELAWPDWLDRWQPQELLAALVVLMVGLSMYAYRRWRELCCAIAAYQQAERTLRASEARYHAVVEQAAEGIVLADAATLAIVEANPAFGQLLGYTPVELQQHTLYDLIAHDHSSIASNVRRVRTARHCAIGERSYRHRDGRLIAVEVSATVLTRDTGILLCIVVRDLTARKQAEAALRASEARYRAIFASLPISCALLDLDGRMLAANPAAERFFGYNEDELCRLPAAIHTHPDDLPEGQALYAKLITGQETHYQHVKRYRRPDGTIRWGRLTVALVAATTQTPPYVISTIEDLTAQKQIEQNLRRLQSGLTKQEANVLYLLGEGHRTAHIASALHIQPDTVSTHIHNIGVKLGVTGQPITCEAILAAARQQSLLVTPPTPIPDRPAR